VSKRISVSSQVITTELLGDLRLASRPRPNDPYGRKVLRVLKTPRPRHGQVTVLVVRLNHCGYDGYCFDCSTHLDSESPYITREGIVPRTELQEG
jgi:hypothetical protein